jgi:hypothetical protein
MKNHENQGNKKIILFAKIENTEINILIRAL